jgi:hypothetical protein
MRPWAIHVSVPRPSAPLGLPLRGKLLRLPRQYPDIIDQPVNHLHVLMRLALHGPAPLCNHRCRIDFDFEFVFFFRALGMLHLLAMGTSEGQ